MPTNENALIKSRVDRIRTLCQDVRSGANLYEAVSLSKSVLYDTLGSAHPLMASLDHAFNSGDWQSRVAVSKSVIALYDDGALRSPRLAIAHEIEGDILDIAQKQANAAEKNTNDSQKQVQIGIAAFCAGAALEDALRRLCDSGGMEYDTQRTSISKLQAILYQPSKQIEVISASENKQITVWGDTRNKADHGKFDEITFTEVIAMIMGVRAFIDKHLP